MWESSHFWDTSFHTHVYCSKCLLLSQHTFTQSELPCVHIHCICTHVACMMPSQVRTSNIASICKLPHMFAIVQAHIYSKRSYYIYVYININYTHIYIYIEFRDKGQTICMLCMQSLHAYFTCIRMRLYASVCVCMCMSANIERFKGTCFA